MKEIRHLFLQSVIKTYVKGRLNTMLKSCSPIFVLQFFCVITKEFLSYYFKLNSSSEQICPHIVWDEFL